MKTIQVEQEGHVLRVRLNRPEAKNAFDETMIAELTAAFSAVKAEDAYRAVAVSGEGGTFCAGGDLGWMQRAAAFSKDENQEDALRLFRMYLSVRNCPKPVVAFVQGYALGGGSGLAAASDRVVAEATAVFGFTEVRLGIMPGAISPFVVEKIGAGHARDLFTSGRRFSAEEGLRIGLVHGIGSDFAAVLEDYRAGALGALVEAKKLAFDVASDLERKEFNVVGSMVARRIAAKRADSEAKEGFAAFFDKRKPKWAE